MRCSLVWGQNARIRLIGKKEQYHTSLGALADRLHCLEEQLLNCYGYVIKGESFFFFLTAASCMPAPFASGAFYRAQQCVVQIP